jgi:hypothetical protein
MLFFYTGDTDNFTIDTLYGSHKKVLYVNYTGLVGLSQLISYRLEPLFLRVFRES